MALRISSVSGHPHPSVGTNQQNQPLLSSSLQTAHNLRLLPDLVSNLLADLNDAVSARIQKAFDSAAMGREIAGKGGSRLANSSANSHPQTGLQTMPSSFPLAYGLPTSQIPAMWDSGRPCYGRD